MSIYDMPEQYRDTVPINSVGHSVPALVNKHYMWPFAKAEWDLGSDVRPLIDWATRKNCIPSINIEAVNIAQSGGGVGSGTPRELVTDINGAYDSQVTTSVQPQDIIPMTRMDRIIPQSTMPQDVPQVKWDEQDQFLRDSCDKYWMDLGSSNANPALQPSIFIFNCIETTGTFSWYTTFRNTDAAALDDDTRRAWDAAMSDFYIRSYKIVREYFLDTENTAVLMYTNMSQGWDGQRGRERMPQQAADMYEGAGWDMYYLADVEQFRRKIIKKIQDLDRAKTGENQRGFKTLPPDSEFARQVAYWYLPGPERAYEMEYRTWTDSKTSTDIPGQIVERLSLPWYNGFYLNSSWAAEQYRSDEQLFWPIDRVGWRLFWPKLFNVNKSDWYFMAYLTGAANLKTELIIQPAM